MLVRVKIAAIHPSTGEVSGQPFYIDADLVAMSGGFTPVVNLHSQARGKIRWDEEQVCFRPSAYHEAAICVGGCNGIFGVADAMQDGATAGADAATATGHKAKPAALPEDERARCG
jgi:sarcosine oxidase subunit alpha